MAFLDACGCTLWQSLRTLYTLPSPPVHYPVPLHHPSVPIPQGTPRPSVHPPSTQHVRRHAGSGEE